jgi:hypothetical protein
MNDRLLASLREALRFIEVRECYHGSMTADEVEAAVLSYRAVSAVEIGANSANVLARFNLAEARALIAEADAPRVEKHRSGDGWIFGCQQGHMHRGVMLVRTSGAGLYRLSGAQTLVRGDTTEIVQHASPAMQMAYGDAAAMAERWCITGTWNQ